MAIPCVIGPSIFLVWYNHTRHGGHDLLVIGPSIFLVWYNRKY